MATTHLQHKSGFDDRSKATSHISAPLSLGASGHQGCIVRLCRLVVLYIHEKVGPCVDW